MSLRIATGTDGPRKERKGLKRKFAAYAGLAFGLILIAGLFAGCGKKDTADADVDLSIFAAKSLNGVPEVYIWMRLGVGCTNFIHNTV